MAVTHKVYTSWLANALGSTAGGGAPNCDFLSDTIKLALTSSSYTPNQNTHDFFDDITNELAATGGYSSGGATLGSKTMTATANAVTLDAADVTWTSATFTARYAILYDATPGTNATRPLISYVDFGGDQTVSGGDFTVSWNASGIIVVTIS
jgi:hypothetical protein